MVQEESIATMLMAVFVAGAVTARQLGTGTHAVLACRSTYTRSNFWERSCGCYFGLDERRRQLPAGRPSACAGQNSVVLRKELSC